MKIHFRRSFGIVLSFLCILILARGTVAHAQLPSFQTPYVTRAEAAMILLQARVPNIPALQSNGEFPDVPKGAWYERYVVIGERLGIVQAHAVTRRIRPEDPVTRAEFVFMVAKTYGLNTALFSTSYEDIPAEAWYAPAAGVAQRFHFFPTDPDQSTMKPEEFMIHSEVAKIVQVMTDVTANAGQWKQIAGASSSAMAYETISTDTQKISMVKSRGAAPRIGSYVKTQPAVSNPKRTIKLRQDILALVNAERAAVGLPGLRMNTTLEISAQEYALAMAEQGFFGHTSPAGENLKARMERSGYYRPFFQTDCLCVARYLMGENLARGQKSSKEVVRDWLNSPTHREAIMNPDFTDTGIGIIAGVWVEHFGGKQK